MNEIVKCDSCGVDTPATGSCRVEGFTDVDGYTYGGSYVIAVGICDRCYNEWNKATTVSPVGCPAGFDRMTWINDRVNEAHLLAGGHALARAICAIVDEFAELLSVHYAGGE
jgi:hypothetical protein